jgi:small subunit ribosomal protein S16
MGQQQNQANVFGLTKRLFGMVKIRLARGGAKKRPFYHIVVADARNKRDGRRIEKIGFFNPLARGQEERLRLNLERVDYWTGVGAQLSERVDHLVKQARSSAAV